MKEYVIKLGATFILAEDGTQIIQPITKKGGVTQVISAYGSNISIVNVDHQIKVLAAGANEYLPNFATYANFGELEDSIPLKNGVAYTPEAKFEKVQFNLNINAENVPDNRARQWSWEVETTIRILIGDGKYEQFATDAALNALEAIAQLQLKTAGGEYLGSRIQGITHNNNSPFAQTNIEPEDMPEGTNYAILEFQQLEGTNSSGFIFAKDADGSLSTTILEGSASQDNGAKVLARAELIKVKRLLDVDYTVLSQELDYNPAKVSFEVDASQYLAIYQYSHHKYKWSYENAPVVSTHGFASWKIEFYKR